MKKTLKIASEAMSRLKVLAAQLDKSPERTIEFLLNHHDAVVEMQFNQALEAYQAQQVENAKTSMARIKKRFKK